MNMGEMLVAALWGMHSGNPSYNYATLSELDLDTHGKSMPEVLQDVAALNLQVNTVITGQIYTAAAPSTNIGNCEVEIRITQGLWGQVYWCRTTSANVAPYSWDSIYCQSSDGTGIDTTLGWTPSYFELSDKYTDLISKIPTIDTKLTADGTNPVQGGAIKKYVDTGLQNLNSSISKTTTKTGIFTSWTYVGQSSDPIGCVGNAYATKSGNLASVYATLTFANVYNGRTPSITFFTLPEKFRPKFESKHAGRIIFPIYTDYADTSLERKNDSVMMLGEITEDGKVKTIDYPEEIELKMSQMFQFSTTFVSMGWGQET